MAGGESKCNRWTFFEQPDNLSWKEEVLKCIKCGSCFIRLPDLSVETGKESLVARGRLALLSGHFSDLLPADKEILSSASNCLLCGACAEAGVRGVGKGRRADSKRPLPCLWKRWGPGKWKKILSPGSCPWGSPENPP